LPPSFIDDRSPTPPMFSTPPPFALPRRASDIRDALCARENDARWRRARYAQSRAGRRRARRRARYARCFYAAPQRHDACFFFFFFAPEFSIGFRILLFSFSFSSSPFLRRFSPSLFAFVPPAVRFFAALKARNRIYFRLSIFHAATFSLFQFQHAFELTPSFIFIVFTFAFDGCRSRHDSSPFFFQAGSASSLSMAAATILQL
jgi:hypothetical protein